MADSIEVDVARDADKERVLAALCGRGFDASEVDEEGRIGFEIPCGDADGDRVCAEVAHELESLVTELELPLVPVQLEDRVFLRPPAA